MPRPNRTTTPRFPHSAVKPILFATPAYGRTFTTEENLRTAWTSGKDFKIVGGPYFSIRDLDALRPLYSHIEISGNAHTETVSILISLKD